MVLLWCMRVSTYLERSSWLSSVERVHRLVLGKVYEYDVLNRLLEGRLVEKDVYRPLGRLGAVVALRDVGCE